MSRLSDTLKEGKFAITGEVGPPKGNSPERMLQEANLIKDRVIAVNLTDGQSAVMRVGSIAAAVKLSENGIEPIYQLTCRDRNRIALQSDILSAYMLGVRNILALTGDHPALGDHQEALPVFDLDSVSLLKTISTLKEGKDMADNELEGAPKDLFAGAAVTPGADPLEPQLIKMEKKIDAGAQFFQTQAIYDAGTFEKFMEKAGKRNVPILAGFVFLKSAGMAKYMNEHVAGVTVPDSIIKILSDASKEDRPKRSIELMAEIINKIKPICQGVHLMPMGWEKHLPALLDACGL